MEEAVTLEQLNETTNQPISEEMQVEAQEILPEDILPSHEILRENLKRRTRARKLFTEYKCRFCKKVFSANSDLRNHETLHNPETPYECSLCSYTAKNKKYMSRHVRLRHGGQPKKLACEQCGMRFMFDSLLKKHQRVHTGEKPYKCDYCGKTFNSRYSLKTHLFIHTNEKPFKCSFCDYACRDTSTLRKHHSTHLGLSMRFPCDQCPRRFDTKARLKAHVEVVHMGIEYPKLECDTCHAEYKTRNSLISHIKCVHERARTCICGVCGKLILNSGNLRAHMLVHVDMRPFRCTYAGCDKRFKDTAAVKKHEILHCPDKFLVCQHCGRAFSRRHRLEAHLATYMRRGRCHSNNHRRFYRNVAKPTKKSSKATKTKPGPYICDTCAYKTMSRRKIVDHIHYGHGTDDDRECKICHKTFRKNQYLKLHYLNNHNLEYTTKINKKVVLAPMVHIKQEPPDLEVRVEMELLDIEKEEPLDEYENKLFQYNIEEYNVNKEENLSNVEEQPLNDEELVANELALSEQSLKQIELCLNGKEVTVNEKASVERNIRDEETSNVEETVSNKNDEVNNSENVQHRNGEVVHSEEDLISIEELLLDNEEGILYNKEALVNNEDGLVHHKEGLVRSEDELVHNNGLVHNKEALMNGEELVNNRKELIENQEEQLCNAEQTLVSEEQTCNEIEKEDDSISQEQCDDTKTDVKQDMTDENVTSEAVEATEAKTEVSDDASTFNARKSMPVGEFLQNIVLAEQSDEDEEAESQERLKRRIHELIQQSNKKNGIKRRSNTFGRKLKRVDGDKVPDLMEKYLLSKRNEQTPPDDNHAVTKKSPDATDRSDRRTKKRRKVRGAAKKSKPSKRKVVDDEGENDENSGGKDKRLNNSSMKLIFNMQQCYVCYKIFQTKADMIEHCKEHFDVCNDVTLKKCPFCSYVTHKHIRRHVRLMHKANINISFMTIKDRKDNSNGSRYYCDVDSEKVKEIEIVPSVKILNKRACMELDRKKRELKDKSVLKRKLVRKGKEWVVEHEKIDLSKRLIPKLKGEQDYLERLRLLCLEKKKLGQKILFPCNNCTKVCQNLSALTLHMRRHDPDAKPFKPKVWKHKVKNKNAVKDQDKAKEAVLNTDNRTADPKPIVNNHKCDPELMEFYETNIKGGDVEFWQFLKIYNKMSRDNDFKDLDGMNGFGVEVKDVCGSNETGNVNVDNNNKVDDVDIGGNVEDSDTPTNKNKTNVNSTSKVVKKGTANRNKNKTNVNSTSKVTSIKGMVRNKSSFKNRIKIQQRRGLSEEQYRKRCLAKAKMRREIANKQTD